MYTQTHQARMKTKSLLSIQQNEKKKNTKCGLNKKRKYATNTNEPRKCMKLYYE